MVEPHVAQGETWQVHLYGEATRFFFPPHSPLEPVHLYDKAILKNGGAVLLYSWVCGMINLKQRGGWQGGGWQVHLYGEAAKCVP